MMKEVRFIHTADLHLDTPFRGFVSLPKELYRRIENSTFQAFENVVRIAIEERCDFIIIAGDLYDGENRSLRAQSFMKKQCERLREHDIDVFIIHGNHDHLSGSWNSFAWPSNVHFFSEQLECKVARTKTGAVVHLYGFSYGQREVYVNMTPYYKKSGIADFHIGILHGQAEGISAHDPYAPFRVQELVEKQFDYWALGHIHTFMKLDDTIYYPGNIQGRHVKEVGEKGCLLVTLKQSLLSPLVTFKKTATIIWEKIEISINHLTTVDELRERIEERLEQLTDYNRFLLCQITFIGHGPLHSLFHDDEERNEFFTILNEGLYDEYNVWIVNFENHTQSFIDRNNYLQKDDFIGDVLRINDCYTADVQDEIFKELFKHRKAKKYLDQFSEKEFAEMKRIAEEKILSFLLKDE